MHASILYPLFSQDLGADGIDIDYEEFWHGEGLLLRSFHSHNGFTFSYHEVFMFIF